MIGTAFVDVRGDFDAFEKDVPKRFGGFAKKAAVAFAAAFAATKAVQGLGKTVAAASDLEEAVNVTGLVFGDARGEIDKFAASAATAVGLSETAARTATANFGGLLSNLGFAQDATVDWSKDLTVLASDLASAFNTDPAEAAAALGAGLRGESEPLKKFNVFLSETELKQKAVAMGLAATTGEVTRNQKAQAALAAITEQTNKVQGDFANTSDTLANRQRILKAQWEDTKATIGTALLPAVTAIANTISNVVIPAFQKWWPVVRDAITPIVAVFTKFVAGMKGQSGELTAKFGKAWGDIKAIVSGVITIITAAWALWGKDLIANAKSALRFVTDIIGGALRIIRGIVDVFAGIFTGDWRRIWQGITNILGGAFAIVKAIFVRTLDQIKFIWNVAWNGVRAAFSGLWNGIKSTASNALGGLANIVRSSLNRVLGFINRLVSAWNGLEFRMPGKNFSVFGKNISVPSIGFGTPNLPTIPGLFAGGNITRGGSALVGERGPELVKLPRGAQVLPLDGTERGGGRDISLTINAPNPQAVAAATASELSWLMRTGAA